MINTVQLLLNIRRKKSNNIIWFRNTDSGYKILIGNHFLNVIEISIQISIQRMRVYFKNLKITSALSNERIYKGL